MRRRLARKQSGLTLIEMVATIVVFAVISVFVARFLSAAYSLMINSQKISDADYNGIIAINRIVSDIHTIRSANDITTINSSQLAFTDDNGNTVQYQLSGTNLQRNSTTLASGVQSLAFTYRNSSYTTTATASAVRYISITIGLNHNNLTTSFSTLAGTRGMT